MVFGVVSMRFGVIFGRFVVVWGVSTDRADSKVSQTVLPYISVSTVQPHRCRTWWKTPKTHFLIHDTLYISFLQDI